MLRILLILSLTLVSNLAHNCISNQANLSLPFIPSTAPHQEASPHNRVLQEAYDSIRIHTDFTYVPTDNPQIADYIENQLVPSAVSYFEATLKVNRLQAPLSVVPDCQGLVTPPELVSPGVDADLVVLVGAQPFDSNFVAFAVPCGLSLVDNRPSYGILVYNLNYLPMNSITDDQENLSTTLHELVHVFGFGAALYPYYIDPITKTVLTDHIGSKVINGVTTNYINVEPLTSRLREYFGCDTLEGAYLENEGDVGSAGSHFERRVFMNEFMTASSVTDPVISNFTLALLEGTGWYQVNYNMSEPFNWGRSQGCSFLDGPCVDGNAQPNFPGFCGSLGSNGCTYTARAKAVCGNQLGLPVLQSIQYPQWDYWRNGTTVLDTFADNCPYFAGSTYTDCEDPTSNANPLLTEEVYGSTSKCFTGTLVPPLYQPQPLAYCFSTTCQQQSDGSYFIILTIGSNTVTCSQAGSMTVPGLEGQLDCPDPNTFCVTSNPMFCQKGCSGRGSCVDNVCQCPHGWDGTDCGSRRYAEYCAQCGNAPGYTDCYGDVCQCDPNNALCQSISFKNAAPSVPSNDANSSEFDRSPEALSIALKDMMEPFLSQAPHSGK